MQVVELHQLIKQLRQYHYTIATNGTMPRPAWWKEVLWDIDCKCPSAEITVPFNYDWCHVGRKNRIKFVVADTRDLEFVRQMLTDLKFVSTLQPTLIVSPAIEGSSLDMTWPQKVWEFCTINNLRFSLQIHKVLFGTKKGV
jgi:organic radical activating enzyme